jgi:hypothetical protein
MVVWKEETRKLHGRWKSQSQLFTGSTGIYLVAVTLRSLPSLASSPQSSTGRDYFFGRKGT